MQNLYNETENKLNRDEAFKNLHRKFFDPLEYYIESVGISSEYLNKQERTLIDFGVEKIHYFIAEYNDEMKMNEGGGLEDETEEIEVLELDFENALTMISTGEICDAKTIILLQYAQIHKLL